MIKHRKSDSARNYQKPMELWDMPDPVVIQQKMIISQL